MHYPEVEMRHVLTIGTRNRGKLDEIKTLLTKLPVEVRGLAEDISEVEETGLTFSENAAIKASAYAQQTGTFVLADDSGLEVAILDGRPGVMSARYGGEGTSFAQKMELLLHEIDLAGGGDRRARFVCSLAFASPDGKILHTKNGICEGTIVNSPRGFEGFGYDPLFAPNGMDRTFAQLTEAEKSKISHRGRAFCEIIPFLRDFFAKLT